MTEHPITMTPGRYNENVMTVNITTGPKKQAKERGDADGLATYAGVFGFSAHVLPDAPHY